LVAFVEEAGVGGGEAAGAGVGGAGFGGFFGDVVVGDTEVAPGGGEGGVEAGGGFPVADGLGVAAARVEQVAEVVGSAGVGRVGAQRGFEDGDFLGAGGETVVWGERGGAAEVAQGGDGVSSFLIQPAEGIGEEGGGAQALIGQVAGGGGGGGENRDGVGVKTGAGEVMGEVEAGLSLVALNLISCIDKQNDKEGLCR
jgi:hypothetical protein